MDSEFTMMIYGAIMGVIGSIVTFVLTALCQLWLDRHEYERRQNEAQSRQLRQIHLPTDQEVISINAGRQADDRTESQSSAAGSMVLSIVIASLLIYQTHDPMLGFLMTRRLIRLLKG